MPGDDDPCLTRDQTEIFFDSLRSGNHDLWTARRASVDDPWGAPEPITELNDGDRQEQPQVSGDGLRLYFASGVPSNIFMSIRADRAGPWGPPVMVGEANSTGDDDMGGISANDLVLVVSSKRGGRPDDLYELQRRLPDAGWSAPRALAELNIALQTPRSPHVDDLGLVMFYDLNQSKILWTSRATIEAPWGTPIPVTEIDFGFVSDPWLSPDLHTIYFTVGQGTNNEIYRATR